LKGKKNKFQKPILKWSGRKYPLLNSIIENTPNSENGSYFEPFLGSGSVFINIAQTKSFSNFVLNDSLEELIEAYTIIRNGNLNKLSSAINELEDSYNRKKTHNGREKFYYEKRDAYNLLLSKRKKTNTDLYNLASLLLFINKTCFNGVYRKNSKGKFNVPHGRRPSVSQNVALVTKDELGAFSKQLSKATIASGDYKDILLETKKDDVVYLDPPYVKTVNYYGVEKFDEQESLELKQEIDKLTSKKVKVLMSNSNTEMTKEIFIDKNYFYKELSATRTIERRSLKKENKTSNELLIANFKLI
jgi:DNA adenine methylase